MINLPDSHVFLKITVLFMLILPVVAYTQDTEYWEILNEGKGSIANIQFINDNNGWAVNEGSLLKTNDGGETWNFVSVIDFIREENLIFIDQLTGWALSAYYDENTDYEYTVDKTIDGGKTWNTKKKWENVPNDLCVVNDSVIFVWNSLWIEKTTDDGQNWMDISPDPSGESYLTSVWFVNRDCGIATLSPIDSENDFLLKTIDGGRNWTARTIPGFQDLNTILFYNDSTGYILADNRYFISTTDTFTTWNISSEPIVGIESYNLRDENTIFTIISDSLGLRIIASNDKGFTWENKDFTPVGVLRKIYFCSPNVGFLLSDAANGTNVYKSTDGGNSWVQKIFSYPFKDVWFTDNARGIAAGGWASECFHCLDTRGDVFVTDDGGWAWEKSFETGIIESCHFLNNDVGYILSWEWIGGGGWAGLLGSISKTSDSGKNWTTVYHDIHDPEGYFFTGKDLCFMDDQLGWAVGNYVENHWENSGAGILGSEDGGENWDLIWKYPETGSSQYQLSSIAILDTIAWSVGKPGMIVKYSDRNKWQIQTNVTDLPLNDIFFSDDQHGWIAGGYYYSDWSEYKMILLRTIDGGTSWQVQNDFPVYINDMYFADSLYGWAVGSDTSGQGIVLKSRDGGVNWITQVEGLSAPLNALHVKGDYIWAVGENGLVLKSDIVSDVSIDEKENRIYPTQYALYQNYPNPFNPTTNINYELPITNYVNLSVYNLLGQKVATLVNEKQKAGYYQVEWNASGFASGVYYYRLSTSAGFAQTKKLVLLR